MKTIKHILIAMAAVGLLIFTTTACKTLQNISNQINNLKQLQFKLASVSDFRLAGISLSKISKITDVSIMDGIALTSAVQKKQLPTQFVLNVEARNPNTATSSGKASSGSAADITLSGLDWDLYIDESKTISGGIASPISVPASGNGVDIPLSLGLDMWQFFGNQGYEKIANLALAIGGVGGSPAKLRLDAQPTVKTQFGSFKYPSRINIIDKEWR